MIVLGRKVGEGVMIGKDIRVVFLGCRGGPNHARIGIIAPREIEVLRDELVKTVWGILPIGKEFENVE